MIVSIILQLWMFGLSAQASTLCPPKNLSLPGGQVVTTNPVCVSGVTKNLGAPISEPGLMGRNDIIYFQDFENSDIKQNVEMNSQFLQQSSFVSFKGSHSLLTKFPKLNNTINTRSEVANHLGGTLSFQFKKNNLVEPTEIYFRYYLYIPKKTDLLSFPDQSIWDPLWYNKDKVGYSPANGKYRKNLSADKMPGFAGIYADESWGGMGRGNNLTDGTNGWSARMELDETIPGGDWHMAYYVYHQQARNTWAWSAALKRGVWHCIEGYVKLNSVLNPDTNGLGIGQYDGILKGYVDGKLAFSKTDIRFRSHTRLKIEEIYGNFYIGGGWYPVKDIHIFTDNWVVSKKPIGVFSN